MAQLKHSDKRNMQSIQTDKEIYTLTYVTSIVTIRQAGPYTRYSNHFRRHAQIFSSGARAHPVESAHRWLSHRPRSRLPFFSTWPTVTFPAAHHDHLLVWPVTNYTAWWQRNTCMHNLPRIISKWNRQNEYQLWLGRQRQVCSFH